MTFHFGKGEEEKAQQGGKEGERRVCGFVEALLGSSPAEYGYTPLQWAAHVEFLTLTYDILMLAGKKERLSLMEVNEIRKMTLHWGSAFLKAGFSMYDWTSYFHVFHEHLFWELLRFVILFIMLNVIFN